MPLTSPLPRLRPTGGTHRVGIDIVDVGDVREALRVHGDRYLRRIFTREEVDDCRDGDNRPAPERLAARFAAKEATIKVLRPHGTPIPWRTIETIRRPGGWVELELTGQAARLAQEAGLGELCLSLTHEREVAGATVLACFHHPDSHPDSEKAQAPCTTPSARS